MEKLNLNESVKSSEYTGSNEPAFEAKPILIGAGNPEDNTLIADERRKIVELSNDSILHGYDLAIELLQVAEQLDAVKALEEGRAIIEAGLKHSVESRIEGNIG